MQVLMLALEEAVKDMSIKQVTVDESGRPQGMTLSSEARDVRDATWLMAHPDTEEKRASHDAFFAGIQKDISSRISALGAAVSSDDAALSASEAAYKAAERDFEEKKTRQERASAELELAEERQRELERSLADLQKKISHCQSEIATERKMLSKAKMAYTAFCDGPLADVLAKAKLVEVLESPAPTTEEPSENVMLGKLQQQTIAKGPVLGDVTNR